MQSLCCCLSYRLCRPRAGTALRLGRSCRALTTQASGVVAEEEAPKQQSKEDRDTAERGICSYKLRIQEKYGMGALPFHAKLQALRLFIYQKLSKNASLSLQDENYSQSTQDLGSCRYSLC